MATDHRFKKTLRLSLVASLLLSAVNAQEQQSQPLSQSLQQEEHADFSQQWANPEQQRQYGGGSGQPYFPNGQPYSPNVQQYTPSPGSGLITRCEAPGTGGFFISKDRFPYAGSEAACKALGGSLADLNNQNFLLASDIVLSCAGPNKKAWIGYVE